MKRHISAGLSLAALSAVIASVISAAGPSHDPAQPSLYHVPQSPVYGKEASAKPEVRTSSVDGIVLIGPDGLYYHLPDGTEGLLPVSVTESAFLVRRLNAPIDVLQFMSPSPIETIVEDEETGEMNTISYLPFLRPMSSEDGSSLPGAFEIGLSATLLPETLSYSYSEYMAATIVMTDESAVSYSDGNTVHIHTPEGPDIEIAPLYTANTYSNVWWGDPGYNSSFDLVQNYYSINDYISFQPTEHDYVQTGGFRAAITMAWNFSGLYPGTNTYSFSLRLVDKKPVMTEAPDIYLTEVYTRHDGDGGWIEEGSHYRMEPVEFNESAGEYVYRLSLDELTAPIVFSDSYRLGNAALFGSVLTDEEGVIPFEGMAEAEVVFSTDYSGMAAFTPMRNVTVILTVPTDISRNGRMKISGDPMDNLMDDAKYNEGGETRTQMYTGQSMINFLRSDIWSYGVYLDERLLALDRDFIIEIEGDDPSATDAGNYTVSLRGINCYEGSLSFPFEITRREFDAWNFSCNYSYRADWPMIYDGDPHGVRVDLYNDVDISQEDIFKLYYCSETGEVSATPPSAPGHYDFIVRIDESPNWKAFEATLASFSIVRVEDVEMDRLIEFGKKAGIAGENEGCWRHADYNLTPVFQLPADSCYYYNFYGIRADEDGHIVDIEINGSSYPYYYRKEAPETCSLDYQVLTLPTLQNFSCVALGLRGNPGQEIPETEVSGSLLTLDIAQNLLRGDLWRFLRHFPALQAANVSANFFTSCEQPLSWELSLEMYAMCGYSSDEERSWLPLFEADICDMHPRLFAGTVLEANDAWADICSVDRGVSSFGIGRKSANERFGFWYTPWDGDSVMVWNHQNISPEYVWWDMDYYTLHPGMFVAPGDTVDVFMRDHRGSETYSRLLLRWRDGDADIDNIIDVADLQTLLNQVINEWESNPQLNFRAADLMADERLDVLDIVAMVGLLMATSPAYPSYATALRSDDSSGADADIRIFRRGDCIVLDASRPVGALDITLSGDAAVEWNFGPSLSATLRPAGEDSSRAVVYSMSGTSFPAGESIIAVISPGVSVAVSGATAADTDARRMTVACGSSSDSGVISAGSDEAAPIIELVSDEIYAIPACEGQLDFTVADISGRILCSGSVPALPGERIPLAGGWLVRGCVIVTVRQNGHTVTEKNVVHE